MPYFFAVSDYKVANYPSSNLLKDQLGNSGSNEDCFRLRCSQSCLEQALFQHFGLEGGPTVCLRVLKVLRDISTIVSLAPFERQLDAGLPSTRLQDYLGIDLPLESNGYFSSYAFKTLVLHEWSRYPEKKY